MNGSYEKYQDDVEKMLQKLLLEYNDGEFLNSNYKLSISSIPNNPNKTGNKTIYDDTSKVFIIDSLIINGFGFSNKGAPGNTIDQKEYGVVGFLLNSGDATLIVGANNNLKNFKIEISYHISASGTIKQSLKYIYRFTNIVMIKSFRFKEISYVVFVSSNFNFENKVTDIQTNVGRGNIRLKSGNK